MANTKRGSISLDIIIVLVPLKTLLSASKANDGSFAVLGDNILTGYFFI
jgi:hypothetical protein